MKIVFHFKNVPHIVKGHSFKGYIIWGLWTLKALPVIPEEYGSITNSAANKKQRNHRNWAGFLHSPLFTYQYGPITNSRSLKSERKIKETRKRNKVEHEKEKANKREHRLGNLSFILMSERDILTHFFFFPNIHYLGSGWANYSTLAQ